MSVSYEKLPEKKNDDEEHHEERRSPRKHTLQAVIGVLLIVIVLMVAAAAVFIIIQQQYCGNTDLTNTRDVDDIKYTGSSSGTNLTLLVYALPQDGSCLCSRQEDLDATQQESVGPECYRFWGISIPAKNNSPWLQVKSLNTAQVSWKRSSDLRVAPKSTCQNARYAYAPGIVPQQCLGCICQVESKCQPIGCHYDVTSLSCGYFQIKYDYWLDCGKLGNDWKSCANDLMCSSQCVQNYMKRYAVQFKCPQTCEGFAREHNGGPKGCFNPATLLYWKRLHSLPGCQNLTVA